MSLQILSGRYSSEVETGFGETRGSSAPASPPTQKLQRTGAQTSPGAAECALGSHDGVWPTEIKRKYHLTKIFVNHIKEILTMEK